MFFSWSWVVLSVFIPLGMYLLVSSFQIPWKSKEDGPSSFECGMDPIKMTRSHHEMHFFFIVVLFVLFDLELVVLIPLIYMVNSSLGMWPITVGIIMSLLLLGIIMEMQMGNLDWKE